MRERLGLLRGAGNGARDPRVFDDRLHLGRGARIVNRHDNSTRPQRSDVGEYPFVARGPHDRNRVARPHACSDEMARQGASGIEELPRGHVAPHGRSRSIGAGRDLEGDVLGGLGIPFHEEVGEALTIVRLDKQRARVFAQRGGHKQVLSRRIRNRRLRNRNQSKG